MSVLQRIHPGRLLRRSKSVDGGGGCVKYDINVIRPHSSGYSNNMDSSDVSASTDAVGSSDVFVHGTEPFCNASQPNISENWEDTTTLTDGNDSSDSESSSSSYMTCPAVVDMLPDFDALLGKPLQTPVSVSDIDHTMDANDVVMREICREIERNHIYRMINACECLDAMEEYIINQLPSEHDLEMGNVNTSMVACIDEAICRRLQMAAQCDCQQDCVILPCIQGQRELSSIADYLETLHAASSDDTIETQMLHCLADHAADCYDEMRCTMPWCLFFFESLSLYPSLADEMLILYLRKIFFSVHYDIFNQSAEQCAAIQLQDGTDCNTSSCQVVTRLTPYTDVFLAFGLTMHPIATPTYCVIKRFPSSSCADDLTQLLRKLNHPHIVTHHWLLPQLESKAMFVCTEFHGDSLCEWLRSRHPHGCSDLTHIRTILTHVLSAVEYLHSVNVLYLAWTGSDVALGYHSDEMIFAKLCDFSHAVSMEEELSEEDEEDIRQLLLPAILPPEVHLSLQFSDQWGLGCLLHEIATGRKVHNTFIHDEPKIQREQICDLRMPDLTELDRIHPTVVSLIRDCLQLDTRERASIESLQQRVETLVSL